MADYQEILKRDGVVVVPTSLCDIDLRTLTVNQLLQVLVEAPEFKDPNPADPTWTGVLGGFGAMGNPSSYQHPHVRDIRAKLTADALELDVLPIEGRQLEKVFDRFMYRIAGQTPTRESMHRDESKAAKDGDVIFGGWVNLDDEPQYFSCAPGTHHDVGNQNNGFAKITTDEEKAKYRPLFRRIAIRPGHCVIFYERLVHEVLAIKAKRRTMRMFLGWRVTDHEEPLFGSEATMRWITDQAVPKIKSGQDPPVYPSVYSNYPKNFAKLEAWCERTFDSRCLYTHTVGGGGEFAGTKWTRVKPVMRSLREYGLPLWPEYEQADISLLWPSREWQLYCFDSPDKRVAFKAVTAEEWHAYEEARRQAPDGAAVRRPKPTRVE